MSNGAPESEGRGTPPVPETSAAGGLPSGADVDAPARRLRLRVLGALAVFLVALIGLVYLRGTWADRAARNPTSPADGTVVQLLESEQGQVGVRAAAVIDAPIGAVWAVLSDYDRFAETFQSPQWRYRDTRGTREADGRWRLTGVVETTLGTFPVDLPLTHREEADPRTISWDTSMPGIDLNRGTWTLAPAGEANTLVVLHLEIRVPPYPRFLVHNVLLSQLDTAVESVAAAARLRKSR